MSEKYVSHADTNASLNMCVIATESVREFTTSDVVILSGVDGVTVGVLEMSGWVAIRKCRSKCCCCA